MVMPKIMNIEHANATQADSFMVVSPFPQPRLIRSGKCYHCEKSQQARPRPPIYAAHQLAGRRRGLARFTDAAITDPAALEADLALSRQHGYGRRRPAQHPSDQAEIYGLAR